MKRALLNIFIVTTLSFVAPALMAKNVGDVNFKISCSAESQENFNHALALTHNMMYVQAKQAFTSIRQKEPNCAMAYWGMALTQIHPLWSDTLNQAQFKKGLNLLNKASTLKPLTKLEAGFIDALKQYYHDWQKTTEKQRFLNWEQAQHRLYQNFPNDPEALSFYALLHLATAPKADKTYQHQRDAGKILEELHQKYPMHPAGYHYTIHAYDNPALAKKGEYYAREYDKIAPEAPHALHMPTHIFVRLGLWPETISWNVRSAKAAKNQPLPDGAFSMHYAHALDYLMYAYLQQRKTGNARRVLKQINKIHKIQPIFASGYGIAAARARFYLEQKLWKQAANLPLQTPNTYPWSNFPAAYSITQFAKGMGSVQTGDIQGAKNMLAQLDKSSAQLKEKKNDYWRTLVDSKRKTLQAWIAVKENNLTKGLKLMQQAADLEDSVDKHPVTPSEVLPARELYADMLLLAGDAKQALLSYEATLKINPNRYNSLIGAAIASEKLGDMKTASAYYKKSLNKSTW